MGQNVRANQSAHAVRILNRILRSWQAMDDAPDFLKAQQTLTLTTAASYTLNPERPVRILSARLVQSSTELPMLQLTRDEYDRLPVKTTTGTPTQFYYDRQQEDALFYIWPVLSAANGETVKITYERAFNTMAIDGNLDLPPEWEMAAQKQLAAGLAPAYGSEAAKARLPGEAVYFLNLAMASGTSGESVYFGRA